jgi:hypothetical protein
LFKAPDESLSGAFCLREFLAQLAQFLCQNFPARLTAKKSKLKNPLILQWFFIVPAVGIFQAKCKLSEQKLLTKTKLKGKKYETDTI